MRRRVAVTGMGAVTPLGTSVGVFVSGLIAGRSGVGPITRFDPASLATRIAAEVDLGPRAHVIRDGSLESRDRKVAFACWAAEQAMAEASAAGTAPGGAARGEGACACFGVGLELFSMPDLVAFRSPGFSLPASPDARLGFLQTPSDACVHAIARRFQLGAPPVVLVSACAAGTDAIGVAYRLVASGRRRWALAGGTDSMINPLGVAGFCTLLAMSTRNHEPTAASRPFDRARDGFVLGEGAGALVLEPLDDARARGAEVLAELVGYGTSFDALAISEPHPEGRGAYQAMSRALSDAGLEPEAIDCINAHATGTPKNDPVEALAIRRLLGERTGKVPVCATKSMIGHLVSAAGAVEAIAAIECMRRSVVHPNPNLDDPDPACDLDLVGKTARAHRQRHVLSTSYGFGGQNAAIVLRAAEESP